MEGALVLMFLLTTTSAVKVFGDYEDYSDYKQGNGENSGHGQSGHWKALGSDYKQGSGANSGHEQSGHWKALGSDHAGKGQGEKQHYHNFHSNSGEANEGGSKAGGHVKHQVTKGYQNYHHKDEVGKTTRYVDTFGDSGDHYDSHGADRSWGNSGNSGVHRDHHDVSGYSGQNEVAEKNFNQKKESFNQNTEKKDDYKGNIAELIYAKKPTSYTNQTPPQIGPFQHFPYPHYFY